MLTAYTVLGVSLLLVATVRVLYVLRRAAR